jgi:hypothetical protein
MQDVSDIRAWTSCPRANTEPEISPLNQPIEPITLNFLRTLCGLGGVTPPLTWANASIQTLKRNSTTSPSCIT